MQPEGNVNLKQTSEVCDEGDLTLMGKPLQGIIPGIRLFLSLVM